MLVAAIPQRLVIEKTSPTRVWNRRRRPDDRCAGGSAGQRGGRRLKVGTPSPHRRLQIGAHLGWHHALCDTVTMMLSELGLDPWLAGQASELVALELSAARVTAVATLCATRRARYPPS